MGYFYQGGSLKVGTESAPSSASVDIATLAREFGTPLYIYDVSDVEMRYRAYVKALSGLNSSVHYALKANSNPLLLKKLASWGAGVDTVSAGEIRKALAAGFAPAKIIFSGVAKTKKEIAFAIENQIKQINVESPAELARIIELARAAGKKIDVAFRLNPDVNPQTHPYITTGFRENKFGMDESFLPELMTLLQESKDAVRLRGLTMHIGSLLFDLAVFREAIEKTIAVHRKFLAEGFVLDRLDVGGGLGIRYETADASSELKLLEDFGVMVREVIEKNFGQEALLGGSRVPTLEILTEPGRMLVARSGLLVSEVQYIKRAPAKTFAIVDTGMHHILRPALYQAKHRIVALAQTPSSSAQGSPAIQSYDVVGPICESSDVLAKNVELPEITAGDYLGVSDTGAYGFSMASAYNSHEFPREVLVENGSVTETPSARQRS